MNDLSEAIDASLRPAVAGPVFVRGDSGLTREVAGFNSLIAHEPDVVVGVTSEADVAASVRFAAENALPVYVQSTGHGAYSRIDRGMLLITRRMDAFDIDPDTGIATIGAGVRWKAVVDRAADHGLAPITGSSPHVGAIGFLLGGGLGPLSRTFGFAVDRVRSFRVVTAGGEAVTASADENAELFWALRGGKGGLGVVTEVRIELVRLSGLYGGGLFFEAEHAETVLRTWTDWTATVPDAVTSSVAVIRMPDIEEVPPPLRGRTVVHLRYAYVDDSGTSAAERASEGERILAPIRQAAPVYLDVIGPLAAQDIGHIHNDPEGPLPVWDHAVFLDAIDQDFVTALLGVVGPANDVPLIVAEVRQLGGAITSEPAIGTAVGGRHAQYSLYVVGAPVPELFGEVLPGLIAGLDRAVERWRHPQTNVNFSGQFSSPAEFVRAWTDTDIARLAAARTTYDPAGVFAYGSM